MDSLSAALSWKEGTEFVHNKAELLKLVSPGKLFVCSSAPVQQAAEGNIHIIAPQISHGAAIKQLLDLCSSRYLLLLNDQPGKVCVEPNLPLRLFDALARNNALLAYSAYRLRQPGQGEMLQPLIDYQTGSVRDDFDFGRLLLIDTVRLRELVALHSYKIPQDASGLYGLRLLSNLAALPVRVAEPLYVNTVEDAPDFEREHFLYLARSEAGLQKRLEETFTDYAKRAGFYIPPFESRVDLNAKAFPAEASIVIPVKNRKRTIGQALASALEQRAPFSFNVLVIDNHSSDGTSAVVSGFSAKYRNVIHIIPASQKLEIGGCWNEALSNPACGKFCLQLDSDDLYADNQVLRRMVDFFYEKSVAVVIGSYRVVDFDLRDVPPGIVDHREWSDENGHNNALRVNGFGAPRAFYREIARKIGFPNVSYGEDYAVMLAISREFNIARIYEPLYLCRRWEGNSDARPSLEQMNARNYYKDNLRSREIEKRRNLRLQG